MRTIRRGRNHGSYPAILMDATGMTAISQQNAQTIMTKRPATACSRPMFPRSGLAWLGSALRLTDSSLTYRYTGRILALVIRTR